MAKKILKRIKDSGIEIEKPLFHYYNSFSKKYYPKIPFTYYWYLVNLVGTKGDTLIDFGCGWGDPVEVLQNKKRRYVAGIDIYQKYLDIVQKKGIYDKLFCRNIVSYKSKKKYDIVICSHVLEHLSKRKAESLIDYFESISKLKVVLAMPVGDLPQETYDGNKYQKHLSTWYPRQLVRRGYKVYGFTPKFLYGNNNVIKKLGLLGFLVFFVAYALQPFYVGRPEKCVYMLAIKSI
jgi:hypothetical protein